jgi:phosphoribosylanthranilate isomerase
MEGTRQPRIKICCMRSEAEVRLAVLHGADALGFVSAMPSGAGIVSEPVIARVVPTVPPPVATFLLTSLQDASSIISQQRRCLASTLQFCDCISAADYRELREGLPGIRFVQVIHVTGEESLDEALEVSPWVDALLLDSGNPSRPIKELGGTGRVHDWKISRRIREAAPVPVFLAGGLFAENVGAAIEAVEPFAVDVCSGVRTEGHLDERKLAAFCDAVRSRERSGKS